MLEFDRDRKSMSVICAPPSSSPATANGIQTRAAAKAPSANVLFVKGAAECLLQRSSQVRSSPLPFPFYAILNVRVLRTCRHQL